MGQASGRRILIAGGGTGGHLMPALAIAEGLRQASTDVEPVLVGSRRGVEAALLPQRPFRSYLLPALPVYRRQWWRNAAWPLVLPGLVLGLRRVFRTERPSLVVGTGGYASAPVAWWAKRTGIRLALQEQNAFPGLVTRRFAGHAARIYLGLPEAERHLTPGLETRVMITGNPISPPDPGRRPEARERFGLEGDRVVLLVTGGSQGALAINRCVAAWLDAAGDPGLDIIWVTGKRTYGQFARYQRPPRRCVIDFLDPMADGYAVADLVLGRAGASTVAELCAWGLPSILVPLPTSAAGHQAHNALAMDRAGAAVHLPENQLDPAGLGRHILELARDAGRRNAMGRAARERGHPEATRHIVSSLLTLIDETGFHKS